MTSPNPSHTPAAVPAQGEPPTDTGRAARYGMWILGLGFGGFLLWAALAPLDQGVPAQGTVTIDTKRKPVQHLSGGIIKKVLVGEGDMVKAGQTLIELDEAVARANYQSVRQRYLGMRAMQGRLLAEETGANSIAFHPDLLAATADPLIQSQMTTQGQLFASRRAALKADLQVLEENIQGQQGQLQAYHGVLGFRQQQLALVQDELGNTRALVKEGFATRNRQLELERAEADANAAVAELKGNIIRAQRSVAELGQRSQARKQEYRKEVESQLSDITREVQSDAEKLIAVKADLDRIEIKSPAAGQVVGLAVQTVGGVVQAGQKLMDVVPADETLLLEAQIEPHLIDKVRVGMATDVRFSAFSNSPQLVVGAKVQSLSTDLLTEQRGGMLLTYYLARVSITPEGMKTLGKRQMQPGMPAEIIIKTGERSMLTYLISPLGKRLAAAMKEE
jgi:protease secretion system membrane fusion protein